MDKATHFLRVRSELVRVTDRWRDENRPDDLLLPAGQRLIEAEQVASEYDVELDRIDPDLGAYVQASSHIALLRQRVGRTAAIAFILVAVAAGWFGYQSAVAKVSRQSA